MGSLRPAGFIAAMFAFVGAAFLIEPHAGPAGELGIGVVTWVILIAASRPLAGPDRARVAAVVVIATAGEVLGSLVLGLYEYRRGGIPAFVPPGHGLVYLAGFRLSQAAFVRAHGRAVVRVAVAAGCVWATLGLGLGARPDVVGALAMIAVLAFLLRGREPGLFAAILFVVAILEFYGTAMGTWRWAPEWPVLELPMGNPPSGVAAGYFAFDALSLKLGPRLARLSDRVGGGRAGSAVAAPAAA